jgi:hypothetical protein
MNRARFKIQDHGVLNLAHLTMKLGIGHPEAITLIDVIVFRGPSEANDVALWAHELVHVDQYRDWGVRNFAIRYMRNHNDVEAPAYAKGNGYYAWDTNRGVGDPGTGRFGQLQVGAPGTGPFGQRQIGAFCYTPMGRFGPGPVQPVGAPCFVPTPRGLLNGQIGL